MGPTVLGVLGDFFNFVFADSVGEEEGEGTAQEGGQQDEESSGRRQEGHCKFANATTSQASCRYASIVGPFDLSTTPSERYQARAIDY